ncbi:MAG: hypothetical protein HC781_18145 [Leptolyngbyaceae cyanobacterium CSU_1_4]|nr:hypothetical protein [Leptolyngbyaceae cyanobacterium CSU_1_4]
MTTELDGLTIADLESRYSIARSGVGRWVQKLKELGYPIEAAIDSERRAIYNREQVEIMDRLAAHIKIRGNKIADFPRMLPPQDRPTGLTYETVGQPYETAIARLRLLSW